MLLGQEVTVDRVAALLCWLTAVLPCACMPAGGETVFPSSKQKPTEEEAKNFSSECLV